MVLIDTSVWIDHFRKTNTTLVELLETEQVCLNSLIIGELACGNLKNRKEIISLLHALPQSTIADHNEILFFIDRHKLSDRGIGLIDMHLLASCHIDHCSLWTRDKRLQTVAEELKIAFT